MNIRARIDQEVARRRDLIADGARLLGGVRGLIDRLNEAGIPAGLELSVDSHQENVVTGRIKMPAMETPEVEVKPSITTGVPMPNQPAEYRVFIDFHPDVPRMSISRTDKPDGLYECFDLRKDSPAVPTAEMIQTFGTYADNVIGKTMREAGMSMTGSAPRAFG